MSSLKDSLITWRNRENAAHLYIDTSKPLSKGMLLYTNYFFKFYMIFNHIHMYI